jgi:hypothetical protein
LKAFVGLIQPPKVPNLSLSTKAPQPKVGNGNLLAKVRKERRQRLTLRKRSIKNIRQMILWYL